MSVVIQEMKQVTYDTTRVREETYVRFPGHLPIYPVLPVSPVSMCQTSLYYAYRARRGFPLETGGIYSPVSTCFQIGKSLDEAFKMFRGNYPLSSLARMIQARGGSR